MYIMVRSQVGTAPLKYETVFYVSRFRMVPVLKTFWKHHKSKELHFLHKSYIQKNPTPKKIKKIRHRIFFLKFCQTLNFSRSSSKLVWFGLRWFQILYFWKYIFCFVHSVRFPGSKRSGNIINEKNVNFCIGTIPQLFFSTSKKIKISSSKKISKIFRSQKNFARKIENFWKIWILEKSKILIFSKSRFSGNF